MNRLTLKVMQSPVAMRALRSGATDAQRRVTYLSTRAITERILADHWRSQRAVRAMSVRLHEEARAAASELDDAITTLREEAARDS